MATRIRLKRIGSKGQPYYRMVICDQRTPNSGKAIEEIGHYNPHTDPPTVVVKEDRALHWLMEGAQPSESARALLSRAGVLAAFAEAQKAAKAEKSAAKD